MSDLDKTADSYTHDHSACCTVVALSGVAPCRPFCDCWRTLTDTEQFAVEKNLSRFSNLTGYRTFPLPGL